MNKEKIESTVIECVAESLALEISDIKAKSLLINELGADSLDFMDIMFHLEDAFKIKMQREDLDFMTHIELSREEAIKEGYLTSEAKEQLKKWLPDLTVEKELKPIELSDFLSIESLCIVIDITLAKT